MDTVVDNHQHFWINNVQLSVGQCIVTVIGRHIICKYNPFKKMPKQKI